MTKEISFGGKKGIGRVALVDDEDYDLVQSYRWYMSAVQTSAGKSLPYARTRSGISMHGLIFDSLGINHPQGIDHIDHDGLNNKRSNLRIANQQQNNANGRPRIGGTSLYKGVGWHERDRRWRARIVKDGHEYYLGYYDNEMEAARAYNKKALELFGEYACLNELEE